MKSKRTSSHPTSNDASYSSQKPFRKYENAFSPSGHRLDTSVATPYSDSSTPSGQSTKFASTGVPSTTSVASKNFLQASSIHRNMMVGTDSSVTISKKENVSLPRNNDNKIDNYNQSNRQNGTATSTVAGVVEFLQSQFSHTRIPTASSPSYHACVSPVATAVATYPLRVAAPRRHMLDPTVAAILPTTTTPIAMPVHETISDKPSGMDNELFLRLRRQREKVDAFYHSSTKKEANGATEPKNIDCRSKSPSFTRRIHAYEEKMPREVGLEVEYNIDSKEAAIAEEVTSSLLKNRLGCQLQQQYRERYTHVQTKNTSDKRVMGAMKVTMVMKAFIVIM